MVGLAFLDTKNYFCVYNKINKTKGVGLCLNMLLMKVLI